MFCAWSLCALLRIQQKRLAAPPRFIITRGSAAVGVGERHKRDIAEVKCHTLTKSMHGVIQPATGRSRWRLLYFNETLQRWRRRPPTPPPAVCSRLQDLGVHHMRNRLPGVLCSTSCCWRFPLQFYVLIWHCHVWSTIFTVEIADAYSQLQA